MGLKPKNSTDNVNQNYLSYKVANLKFTSVSVYFIIKSIDIQLRKLYVEFSTDSFFPLWSKIENFKERVPEESFKQILDILEESSNQILDIVEENINKFDKKVIYMETEEAAFNQEFKGILNFLCEANFFRYDVEDGYSVIIPISIKNRYIKLADRLIDLGIQPNGDFY